MPFVVPWSAMDTVRTFLEPFLPFGLLPLATTMLSVRSMDSSKLDISLKRFELQVSMEDWEGILTRGLERLILGIFCCSERKGNNQ